MEGTGNEHLSPIGKATMKKAGYIIFFVPILSNHEYIYIRPLEIHSLVIMVLVKMIICRFTTAIYNLG